MCYVGFFLFFYSCPWNQSTEFSLFYENKSAFLCVSVRCILFSRILKKKYKVIAVLYITVISLSETCMYYFVIVVKLAVIFFLKNKGIMNIIFKIKWLWLSEQLLLIFLITSAGLITRLWDSSLFLSAQRPLTKWGLFSLFWFRNQNHHKLKHKVSLDRTHTFCSKEQFICGVKYKQRSLKHYYLEIWCPVLYKSLFFDQHWKC